MRDALKVELLHGSLAELVKALEATNWSVWQTTARFDPALSEAREVLNLCVPAQGPGR